MDVQRTHGIHEENIKIVSEGMDGGKVYYSKCLDVSAAGLNRVEVLK